MLYFYSVELQGITNNSRYYYREWSCKLFCVVDDFCKFFDAMMVKYTLKPETKRKYHHDSTMSKAEIMLVMILFHDFGYRCLKHFYQEKICKHMRHLFPKVVSCNRFVELEKEVAIPLALFIKYPTNYPIRYINNRSRDYCCFRVRQTCLTFKLPAVL